MSEKFIVNGGLEIPANKELKIGSNALSGILTGNTLSNGEDNKKVIPSEYSVKTYVDARVSQYNQWSLSGVDSSNAAVNFSIDSDSSDALTLNGTANEIEVHLDSTDEKVTFGLPSSVDITTDLEVSTLNFSTGSITDDNGSIDFGDENLTMGGSITVGADDTGFDVTFYGASTGKKMLWDESADTLDIDGVLNVSDASTFQSTVTMLSGSKLSSDSADAVTANADIANKAYVDSKVGNTSLNLTTDDNSTFNAAIDLDSENLSVLGTTKEIEAKMSADNTIKIGLPDTVQVTTKLETAALSATGATNLDSTVTIGGTLSMGANAIEGSADEMIISADGDENSVSGSTSGSLSLNASGGIFTDDAVDMDSTLDVAGATSLAATGVATTIRGTLSAKEAATFDAGLTTGGNIVSDTDSIDSLGSSSVRWLRVHSDELEMTNSHKKDFEVAMDGSAKEIASLTGFESGKIVLKVKDSSGNITSKEILAVNGAFVEYATISSGTEVEMTIAVSGNSVTCNSANGTAKGTIDLVK